MSSRVISTSTWTGNSGVATINLSITVQGVDGAPLVRNAPTLQVNYSCWKEETYDLASGFNEITVPVSATNVKTTGVLIVLPEGNTDTITLKGVTGDTGVKIHPGSWAYLPWTTTATIPTTLGITAGAAVEGVKLYWH